MPNEKTALLETIEMLGRPTSTPIPNEIAHFIGPLEGFSAEAQEKLNAFMRDIPEKPEIVGLGKGWFVDPISHEKRFTGFKDAFSRLSSEAKLTTIACGLLYLYGKSKKILFSAGKTAGNRTGSEAVAMREYLFKVFGDKIPQDVVGIEEESMDTLGAAKNVTPSEALIVTIGYHESRSRMIFDQRWGEGVARFVKSDELVGTAWPKQRYIEHMKHHLIDKLAFERVREAFAHLIYRNRLTGDLMQLGAEKKRSK